MCWNVFVYIPAFFCQPLVKQRSGLKKFGFGVKETAE
jgi:hypothetical protein